MFRIVFRAPVYVGSVLGGALIESIDYTYTFLVIPIMVLAFNLPLTYFVLRGQTFANKVFDAEVVDEESQVLSTSIARQESAEVCLLS